MDDGGLARLKARIDRMSVDARATIREALEKGADEIVTGAKALAPRGKTGALAASIRKLPGAHELQVKVGAGDSQAFYARWVEFGTVDTDPHPFLRPAYRLAKRRALRRIRRAVRAAARTQAIGGGDA